MINAAKKCFLGKLTTVPEFSFLFMIRNGCDVGGRWVSSPTTVSLPSTRASPRHPPLGAELPESTALRPAVPTRARRDHPDAGPRALLG